MDKLLVIGVGGFVGAIARHVLAGLVQRRAGALFPAGTLGVNVVGCLLLGALFAVVESRPALGPQARSFLAVGILGSFTTFSTFSYETLELVRLGAPRLAFGNVAASVVLGLTALWLGRVLVRALIG